MSAEDTLGLVRIGPLRLAVPAMLIERILKGPLTLSPMPQAPNYVPGLFAFEGKSIPVVDLGAYLQPAGVEQCTEPSAYALVIRHAGERFALQVDEVLGVERCESGNLTALTDRTHAYGGLFDCAYVPPGGGAVSVVINLERIFALFGVSTASCEDSSAQTARNSRGGLREPHLIFRAGDALLAVNAIKVRQVGMRPEQLHSVLSHPILEGFHRLYGRDFPVARTLPLLELGLGDGRVERQLLVLDNGEGILALSVDEVCSIESVALGELHPMEPGLMPRGELYQGSLHTASGQVAMVLDVDALLASESMVDCRELFSEVAQQLREEEQGAGEGALASYLVLRSGGRTLASPLLQVDAVMAVPPGFADLRTGDSAFVGLCERLGQSVRVLDLALLLGESPTPLGGDSVILCRRSARGVQGYLVARLDFLLSTRSRSLPTPDLRPHGRVPPFERMIRVRRDGLDKAACVLELDALATVED